MAKLTAKQALFVAEYLVDLNATQAAIRAGYSKKSASRFAIELLQKTHVEEAIRAAMHKRAAKVERTAANVLEDLRDTTEKAKESKDFKAAMKGHELEMKHMGMLIEKVELSGKVDLAGLINEARKRAK